MEANRNYINENIVNISLMAGKLMADGKISVEDHAELTDHIVAMAESFVRCLIRTSTTTPR